MKKLLSISIMLIIIAAISIYFMNQPNARDQYAISIQEELKELKAQLPEEPADEKALGQPNMAALQDFYQTMDPSERRVPQERLVQAHQQIKEMQAQNQFKNTQGLQWENIPSNMGGRTRSIMWDPNISSGNRVWAGSVTGGIWYNNDITNAYSPWQAVDDFLPSLSISSLAYDPNNTTTFYAGTGEAPTAIITYRESSGRGIGIWKSEDGGESWNLLESTEDFAYITDIEVRDEDGQSVIYAGVGSGIYKGENHTSTPTDGLYRSVDGGESWEQVLPNISRLETPYMPASIEFGADGRVYIGTMRNINGDGGGCILYSDEGTEGTWTLNEEYKEQIEAGIGEYYLPGRVMISPASSNENVVYAIIGAGFINGFGYYRGNFILRSDDKGENWTELNIPNNNPSWASLSWHAFVISVNPENEDHFYIGGLDVYHSLNAGSTYRHVSDWAMMYYGGGDEYIHGDIHAIEFKPGNSDEIIFSTDGGVFYTDNGLENYPDFQERNHQYSSLQFYSCAIHPEENEEEYMGGLQDNGTLRYEGSDLDINDMISGGDGAFCLYNQINSNISLSSIYYNRYYVYDNGFQTNYLGYEETGTFVCPADLDDDDNILFANGVGFFLQNDNTLFRVSNLPNGSNVNMVPLGTEISTWFTSVVYSPHSEVGKSTLFIGSNDGHLFRIEDAESNPNSIEIGSDDFPTGAISCIAIGGSEDSLLVTFSNYGVSSIWKTYDGGDNWMEAEGNLPDMPVRWALFHPYSSNVAMIATEMGIWTCNELSATSPVWIPQNNGLANVRIDQLDMRANDLTVLAASHGRGLFTTTFDYHVVGMGDELRKNQIQVYPNPSNGAFYVDLQTISEKVNDLQILDLQGKVIYETNQVSEKIFVDLSNYSKGIYVIQLKTSFNNHYTKKISIH